MMIQEFLSLFQHDFYVSVWRVVVGTWPIWLPLILLNFGLSAWLSYIRRARMRENGYVLLEIRLPRDTDKTPAAMEFVLDGMWEDAAISTLADTYWKGKLRDWYSLEVVSIGGEVRFFIWAIPEWKKIIETRIYAQYPNAEVVEVEDYLRSLVHKPGETKVWGVTTSLSKKKDALPIKTYIDYELDKARSKEQEEVVDPITPLLEYLGTLKPGEIAVIQILIQAHRKETWKDARIIPRADWKESVKDAIKEVIEKEAHVKADEGKSQTMMMLSDDQKEAIRSIERNAGKLAFDAMIRYLYFSTEEAYDKTRGKGIIGSTRQFGTHNLNGLKPEFFSPTHSWQDFGGQDMIKNRKYKRFLESCKRRSFFNVPYKYQYGKPYILTTEELATLFHLPGKIATTPSLSRVASKKSSAPSNLPV